MKFIALLFLCCSCHLKMVPYNYVEPLKTQHEEDFTEKVTTTNLVEATKWRVRNISFSARKNLVFQEERKINMIAYESDQKRPALIIYPISKGHYQIAKYFAEYFVQRGIHSYIIKRNENYNDFSSPSQLNNQLHETLYDNRQIVDYLQSQSHVDKNKIAILGVSKGGIKTSLIIGDDSRIKAAIIAIAGGELPELLSVSTDRGVTRMRTKYITKNQISIKGFERDLAESLTLDPLSQASKVDGRKTLHFLAYFDNVVPYKYGQNLASAMQGSRYYTLIAGHYSTILYLPFVAKQSHTFLIEKLEL